MRKQLPVYTAIVVLCILFLTVIKYRTPQVQESAESEPLSGDLPLSVELSDPIPGQIVGYVVEVLDGDTFDIVTRENKSVRILLYGIDAPEIDQPFGDVAKGWLSQHVEESWVRFIPHREDDSGVTFADVYAIYPRPIRSMQCFDWNLSFLMISKGLAWHDMRATGRTGFADVEFYSADHKYGLWATSPQTAPWEWRKLSKEERDKLR